MKPESLMYLRVTRVLCALFAAGKQAKQMN